MRSQLRIPGATVVTIALFAALTVVATVTEPVASAAATSSSFCGASPATESPSADPLDSYTAQSPQRLVDTRSGLGGLSNPLAAGCTLRLDLSASTVPFASTAVALSVTAVAPDRGFFAVFPCAAGRPGTSNLNARAGVATANLVVAMLDSNRQVCIFSNAGGDLVVDLAGYWSAGASRFGSVPTVRAYDSRTALGGSRLPAGAIQNVELGGASLPADATAAMVNLTVTDAATRGWFVAYPCGTAPPLASNLNFVPGESRAVAAIVALGASGAAAGQLCVRSNADVQFIVDVVGYYAPTPPFGPAATLRPTTGRRLADSRSGTGGWSTPFKAGETRTIDPVALEAVADEAASVMLNVVATNSPSRGNLRVYPCGSAVPLVSSLNMSPEGSVTNLVPVELSSTRTICVYASQPTDVVIDLFGVFAAPDDSLVERMSFGSMAAGPEFSVRGADYWLRCAAGVNPIRVTVDRLPGATVRINGVLRSNGVADVAVSPDGLVTIVVSRPGRSLSYFFRCLPPDFPTLTVDRPGSPAPGWYLTTFGQGDVPPGAGKFAVIFDNRGAPVWYKRLDKALINLQRLDDGTLLATELAKNWGIPSDNVGHRIMSTTGALLARIRNADNTTYPMDHHDVAPIDGGWAVITHTPRSGVDLTSFGAGFGAAETVVDGHIIEIDDAGVPIPGGFEWDSIDHFDLAETQYPERFNRVVLGAEPGEVALIHINALTQIGDGTDDYLVSGRHLDAVFRLDHDTGTVEWILGSLPSDPLDPDYVPNKDGATRLEIVGDPLGGPLRPHDVQLDGDVLTLLDNRTNTTEPARAVAYRIDEVAGTATLLWQISQPQGLPSPAQGSVRTADDGSVLVDWGTGIQPMFEEFDASGNRMMAITQTPSGNSYRIIKYGPDAFNLGVLRANAGGSVQAPTP